MQKVGQMVYKELLNKEYWDLAYERMINKPFSSYLFDSLFTIKETQERERIAKALVEGTYKWSIPEKLMIAKSGTKKKRIVYMYSEVDRYVLGVLYRALSNLFEDRVADNCYSYKRGVNTSDAIKEISKADFENLYGLKLDISAYFNSVPRGHLNKCLEELFGVDTGIRKTMDQLFNNDKVLFRDQEIEEYKALIPGCALGSFFANYCLRDLDYHFKENNILYARYSDDIIFFAETAEVIEEHLQYVKDKLKEYGLEINEKKYVHFQPGEAIEYLGLKLSTEGIDISDHAKEKVKKTIHRWTRKARRQIEIEGISYEEVARKLLGRFNYRMYKCYIEDARKFGWGYYAFRYLTLTKSLTELDFYLRDRLRYLKTGKHNKANVKAVSNEELERLGLLSIYDMYKLFKYDFEYYCEVVSLIKI